MKTISQKSISLKAAMCAAQGAQDCAARLGMAIAVSVVDQGGVSKFFCRMDGAALVANEAAWKKARTAVGFGMPTGTAWHDFIKDDPILNAGAHALQDFILLGGGLPIYVEDVLVGAIGVAGGHYAKDEECAKAALLAIRSRCASAFQ